MLNKEKPEV